MSSRLACELSESIAASGPVAGVRYPEDCNPTRPVPVITFHGKNDTVNHYSHQVDSPDYWRMGVEDAIGGWVKKNTIFVPLSYTHQKHFFHYSTFYSFLINGVYVT